MFVKDKGTEREKGTRSNSNSKIQVKIPCLPSGFFMSFTDPDKKREEGGQESKMEEGEERGKMEEGEERGPAKKWVDTEIAERGRSVLVMRARYRSTGLTPHQRGWTDAG